MAASPLGAAKPTPFDEFAASHPRAPAAFATAATPDSYADEGFWGIDAFLLVNKDGQEQAVRYEVVPQRLVHLDAADAAKRTPDFLTNELAERLQHGSVTFHLKAQLAAPGDSTKDPSQPWLYDRREVELGVLSIDKLAADGRDQAVRRSADQHPHRRLCRVVLPAQPVS